MTTPHMLVATDLADATHALYHYAARWAKATGAHVTLLHANPMMRHGVHSLSELEAYYNDVATIAERSLEAASKVFEDYGVEHTARLESALPAEAIIAASKDADLIVMARRKAGALARLVLGSTTKRVVRHAEVPVLIVDATRIPTGPIRRIVVPTDMSEDSQLGLSRVAELAPKFDAHIEVVHAFKWPMSIAIIPGDAPTLVPGQELGEKLRRIYEGEVRETVVEISPGMTYKVVSSSDVADTIVSYAKERDADLIAIPTHGKGGLLAALLGSTSERVLELSHLPVLLLPRTYLRSAS